MLLYIDMAVAVADILSIIFKYNSKTRSKGLEKRTATSATSMAILRKQPSTIRQKAVSAACIGNVPLYVLPWAQNRIFSPKVLSKNPTIAELI